MDATLSRLPPKLRRRAGRMSSKLLRRAAHPPSPLVAHALSIVEVPEAILLHVDQRTLLVACLRVSKEWKEVINESLPLQQRLFFSPAAGLGPGDHACSEECPCPVNPLLHWGFPGWFHIGVDDDQDGNCLLPDVNISERFHALPWQKNVDAWRRKEASWRRMEVTQPPTRALEVVWQLAYDCLRLGNDTDTPFILPQDDGTDHGFLMGDLYDYIVKMALQHALYFPPGTSFPRIPDEVVQAGTIRIHPYYDGAGNHDQMTMRVDMLRHALSNFQDFIPTFQSEASTNRLASRAAPMLQRPNISLFVV